MDHRPMREPSLSLKLTAVAGLLVGGSGALWLALSGGAGGLIPRVGFVCAGLCATACSIVSWAAIFAYVIRKMNWPPKSCVFAGLCLAVPGWLVLILSNSPHALSLGSLLLTAATFAIYICRKLAFPEMTDEQAAAPPPPISLFGK